MEITIDIIVGTIFFLFIKYVIKRIKGNHIVTKGLVKNASPNKKAPMNKNIFRWTLLFRYREIKNNDIRNRSM